MRWKTRLVRLLAASVALAAPTLTHAVVPSSLDRVQGLLPGLSIRLVCAVQDGSCAVADPNGLVANVAEFAAGPTIDAEGRLYAGGSGPPQACGFCANLLTEGAVLRLDAGGLLDTVLTLVPSCDGSEGILSSVYRIQLDNVAGRALLLVHSDRIIMTGGGMGVCNISDQETLDEVIELSGLPDLLGVIPAGPPGAEGPAGPAGPPGPPGPLVAPCLDADADGFADCAVAGCFSYGHACGDCDDADAAVNPARSERRPKRHRHDGKDNDCNGVVDG